MHQIPIVISRLNERGVKENHRLQEVKPENNDCYLIQVGDTSPNQGFNTIDQCEKRSKKIRMRRIQSSGTKRKLPKDFFSRESNRPNKEDYNQKEKTRTLQHTKNYQENNEKYDIETPKFTQKCQQKAPIQLNSNPNSNIFKRTFHQNENKIKIRSCKKATMQSREKTLAHNKLSETKPTSPFIVFQNTFSANQFSKIPQWTCKPFQINMANRKVKDEGKEKENRPMKKKSKGDILQENKIKRIGNERIGYFNKLKFFGKVNE